MKKIQKKHTGKLFILSGPSGVGKTVVADKLLDKSKKLHRVITYTTRSKRRNEKHGRDYYFVSPEKFKKLLEKNFFIEWAEVHNHLYGTPKPAIEKHLKKNKNVILVIDIQGAQQVKKILPETILIFIKPDNMHHLESRIKKRKGSMSEEDLIIRLANAKKELTIAKKEYDHIVINRENKIEHTINDILKIIQSHSTPKLLT